MSTNIVPHFFATVALAVATFGTLAYNTVNGTEEVISDEYAVTYSKCDQWNTGAKGVQHCAKWGKGVEYRVDTLVKGPLFNYKSYRVVAK